MVTSLLSLSFLKKVGGRPITFLNWLDKCATCAITLEMDNGLGLIARLPEDIFLNVHGHGTFAFSR